MAADLDFDEFYRGTFPRLLRYAYGLTTDLGQAQDLVQEAYTRAWQRWRRLRDYDDPEAWLRLVVTRLAADWWRAIGVRRRADAAARPPDPLPPPDEDLLMLVAALRVLPLPQRRALALHYLLDQSTAQIAHELGVNHSTVRSWLHRGRQALAAVLRPAADHPPATDVPVIPRPAADEQPPTEVARTATPATTTHAGGCDAR